MALQFNHDHTNHGFSYVFDTVMGGKESVVVQMPPVSPNKRGVNDIGWQTDGSATLYGTLCRNPESEDTLWQEIEPFDEVNKTIRAIKIVNETANDCRVIVRVIMN